MACRNCGSTEFADIPIHNGRSVRRDCANCKRFIDFPVWYGESEPQPEATKYHDDTDHDFRTLDEAKQLRALRWHGII